MTATALPVARLGGVPDYERAFPLDDIQISRSRDGRTVEAYAAIFNEPYEVLDQQGHYMEVIDRSAFDRALTGGIHRVGVFYHHGMTLHGTPSDLGSVPIGSPVDIRADTRGLFTVTRFNGSALADSVLEAIRAGDIRGYSFRGRIFQSDPERVPRTRPGDPLQTVTRLRLGLAEYGPTPTPMNAAAAVTAVRYDGRQWELARARMRRFLADREREERVRAVCRSTRVHRVLAARRGNPAA